MIKFEHVTKQYRDTAEAVFTNFSTCVQPGEFVLLTGRSGAGKSTWIRMVLKDTEPSSGRILVNAKDISLMKDKEVPYYRRRIGVVFQDASLIRERTAYENVALARIAVGARTKDNRKVIASLFQLLGITDLYKRYPEQMSGGEKQKVCLARALVNYPAILLADEPTGNLSAAESEEIMKLLEVVHRQGITVVVATHDKISAQGLEYREIAL